MRRAGREALADAIRRTRDSTWRILGCLEDSQWVVPPLPTVNPPLWEIGHVGWFQERWCLRERGATLAPSLLPEADRWFDSARVAHPTRWQLDLPPLERVREWMDRVMDASLRRLEACTPTDEGLYHHRLALFHEQFHVEAFAATWQSLGYAQPGERWAPPGPMRLSPDRRLPGGALLLGSAPDDGFVFDNEKWAHPVRVAPFEVSLQPVTNAEFLQFVEDDGYRRGSLWDPEVFERLAAQERCAPATWRRVGERWQMRWFQRWIPIEPYAPVVQVDAFEAEAYCAWAGRRLPSEAEWELAALQCPDFDWGGVWEWTASDFLPYPGFSPDAYRDYSEPWFGTHRVVRGGSFGTAEDLLDAKLRNFYRPGRGDVFVGFRTCAKP
jgi:iron(II)-dependent oxidoreductase